MKEWGGNGWWEWWVDWTDGRSAVQKDWVSQDWEISACLTERSQELIPETRGSQTKLAFRRDHPRRRIKMLFYRAMLCMRGTSLGLCACLCLSQVVLLKRLNTGSQKQTTWSLRESSFFIPKISTKLDWSHPLRGRQMQAGWIKIGDFRKIAGYLKNGTR